MARVSKSRVGTLLKFVTARARTVQNAFTGVENAARFDVYATAFDPATQASERELASVLRPLGGRVLLRISKI